MGKERWKEGEKGERVKEGGKRKEGNREGGGDDTGKKTEKGE